MKKGYIVRGKGHLGKNLQLLEELLVCRLRLVTRRNRYGGQLWSLPPELAVRQSRCLQPPGDEVSWIELGGDVPPFKVRSQLLNLGNSVADERFE
ncbi:hypothetical protein JTE90_018473 [Oedothorax gibbosus]|uniref:Uncharacterized protein n=1 Tax=Oedothorax gibbosus TaxID=931172 RepID=A0AAV6UDS1_9ARAC|nr:hypothetical protein JTE90_018473 [Oedothorax gibbosus]